MVVLTGFTLVVGMTACPDSLREKVATPSASPRGEGGGGVAINESIDIRCDTPEAVIYYTMDGTIPSRNSTRYSSVNKPKISAVCALVAIAFKDGMDDSDVLVENYTVNVNKTARPIASPPAGTIAAGTSITLTTPTAGAAIRWTLDGSTPSDGSGTVYTNENKPVITDASVLKAVAYKDGMDDSGVLTAIYTIGAPDPGDPTALSITITGPDENTFNSGKTIRGVVWGGPDAGEQFVAVAEGGQIAYSTNGETWQQATVAVGGKDINGVAWGGPDGQKKFVAVGREGTVVYSTDGITWANTNISGISSSHNFNGIAWGGPSGGEQFVAVANGGYGAYSADGIAWTVIQPPNIVNTKNISAIAWGGTTFVAAADSGMMARSPDGINWTAIEPGTASTQSQFSASQHIKAVTYGGPDGEKRFIAGGVEGIMVSSLDGAVWARVTNHGLTATDIFRAMAWGAGRFIAAGGKQASPAEGDSRIIVSVDGQTWETAGMTLNTAGNFYGAAYGGGKFILTANAGKLAYSNNVE